MIRIQPDPDPKHCSLPSIFYLFSIYLVYLEGPEDEEPGSFEKGDAALEWLVNPTTLKARQDFLTQQNTLNKETDHKQSYKLFCV